MNLAPGPMPHVTLIDSGVNPLHPHVRGMGEILLGPTIRGDGSFGLAGSEIDEIGHGTAAAAAILDLAPGTVIRSIRVFVERLSCPFTNILRAIEIAVADGPSLINLSLGTTRPDWNEALMRLVDQAARRGCTLVAPAMVEGIPSLPGALDGVVAAIDDADVPRSEPVRVDDPRRTIFRASPFPRDIPGVPRRANLRGPSFAAANVTGFLARQQAGRV